MEQSDKQAFKDLINTMAVAFRAEAGTPLFQAYWIGLEDQAFEHVEAAVKVAIRERDYMPTVNGLRDLARIHARQLELFPAPEERRRLAEMGKAEEERIAATWVGHEEELEEMRKQLGQLVESKT